MQITEKVMLAVHQFVCLVKTEKKKNTKHATGISSTNKFRNWLGLPLLYFANLN
jgi:hypothetical protein